jgi:hypothetical protein
VKLGDEGVDEREIIHEEGPVVAFFRDALN